MWLLESLRELAQHSKKQRKQIMLTQRPNGIMQAKTSA